MTPLNRKAPLALLVVASILAWCQCNANAAKSSEDGDFLIGTGIYDMTGPAAQINFMGYARSSQTAHGIHQRLRARTFIMAERPDIGNIVAQSPGEEAMAQERRQGPEEEEVEEEDRERSLLRWKWRHQSKSKQDALKSIPSEIFAADPEKTVCFVSIDAGMGSDLLNKRVLDRLEELLPIQESSGKRLCHLENLSISGTHTHSAPGGFLQYVLYQTTSYGFFEETMGAFVEGIAQSILRAYHALQPGTIAFASGHLAESNINRSPTSYLLNPQSERDEYTDEGDTDKTMLLLKFQAENGTNVGTLNWFPVHGTSMNASNVLISGDNKGYASYLMEKHYNGNDTLPGRGKFVAAFAATNLGDVSPNTKGPRCIDTGLPCDTISSTCNGRNEMCIASGPGNDMFESTEIIGRNQYKKALDLYENAGSFLSGDVAFRHSFIDMTNITVTLGSGEVVRTCPAALGYSFAAGTTDGPGKFDFTQGSNSSNPFWNMIDHFLSAPTEEQIECHAPKPIFLNTGYAKLPYDWDPAVVPISIFRVGNFFILSVPSEFTTMSGRRLRRAVKDILVKDGGIDDPIITIAGLANSYTHYVATFEEYEGQRYEAASTLFGPHTLSAYIQEFQRITRDLLGGKPSKSSEGPTDLSNEQISLVPPAEVDTIGIGKKFGSVVEDANEQYATGDSVLVSFRSANPRHNQRIEDTFLSVDILDENGSWKTKYVDGDWCTRFYWESGVLYFGPTYAEITWDIPSDTPEGLYRICHYGTRRTLLGDATTNLFNAPDWLVSNSLGSIMLSMLANAFRLLVTYSVKVRSWWDHLSEPKYKDFRGCSRTFLVSK